MTKGLEPIAIAANGLLDRRTFIKGGAAFAATLSGYTETQGATAQPLTDDSWSLIPGATTPPYEQRSRFEAKVTRTLTNPKGEARVQNARTPLHLSQGTVTPNGLHFVVAQSGAPDIDPAKHRLVIHGMVKRPLMFTLDALERYPKVSRMAFIECGGNSAPMFSPQPIQANLQTLHGMVSCSEWTGVLLSTLLAEAGVDPEAKWLIAEGADAPTLTRSVPLKKGLDDAMIALYQNGERLMPANGYRPMAAKHGRKRRCKRRCRTKPSRNLDCRGAGTAAPPSCKAARTTTQATCNPHAPNSSPSAANSKRRCRPPHSPISTSTASPVGRLTPRAR